MRRIRAVGFVGSRVSSCVALRWLRRRMVCWAVAVALLVLVLGGAGCGSRARYGVYVRSVRAAGSYTAEEYSQSGLGYRPSVRLLEELFPALGPGVLEQRSPCEDGPGGVPLSDTLYRYALGGRSVLWLVRRGSGGEHLLSATVEDSYVPLLGGLLVGESTKGMVQARVTGLHEVSDSVLYYPGGSGLPSVRFSFSGDTLRSVEWQGRYPCSGE